MRRLPEFVLYALAAGFTLSAWQSIGDDLEAFPYAVAGLLAISSAELVRQWRGDKLWLADACTLLTMLLFGVSYGLSNVVFLMSPEFLDRFAYVGTLTTTTLLATVGCFFMWRGYRFPPIANAVARYRVPLRDGFNLSTGWCIALTFIAITAVFIRVQLGVFGYSTDESASAATVDYRYTLRVLNDLGYVVITALALVSFGPNAIKTVRPWLFTVTALMVMFGFLSGFKHQVVTPILFVALCYYIKTSRIPAVLIGCGVAALAAAYIVIEPFRVARYADPYFDSYSVTAIASTLLASSEDDPEIDRAVLATQVATRLNLTSMASHGIAYVDDGYSHDDDPKFLERLLLSPAHAVIPRVIWSGKPEATIGGWYTQRVLDLPEDFVTSTAMGPVTYFYFSGGVVAVALGFFALGALCKALRVFLVPSSGGSVLVYVLTLPTLVWIEAGAMDGVLVTLIRTIPIYLVLQHFLFWRPLWRHSLDGAQ